MTVAHPGSSDPGRAHRDLERAEHCLWHGNAFRATGTLEDLRDDFDVACAGDGADDKQRAFFERLSEFCTHIGRNSGEIPNYGERYHGGEPISTATAEATANRFISRRMVKKKQMRWSPPRRPPGSCRSAPASSTTTSPRWYLGSPSQTGGS